MTINATMDRIREEVAQDVVANATHYATLPRSPLCQSLTSAALDRHFTDRIARSRAHEFVLRIVVSALYRTLDLPFEDDGPSGPGDDR